MAAVRLQPPNRAAWGAQRGVAACPRDLGVKALPVHCLCEWGVI